MDKAEIEKLADVAKHIPMRVLNLSRNAKINSRFDRHASESGEVFRPLIWAKMDPRHILIDLKPKGKDGKTDTCESQLRQIVFDDSGDACVGAIATGQGCVGKTCALRAIAHDDEIASWAGHTFCYWELTPGSGRSLKCCAVRLSEYEMIESERKYIFENVYRICQIGGRYDCLCSLVQSAGWIS